MTQSGEEVAVNALQRRYACLVERVERVELVGDSRRQGIDVTIEHARGDLRRVDAFLLCAAGGRDARDQTGSGAHETERPEFQLAETLWRPQQR